MSLNTAIISGSGSLATAFEKILKQHGWRVALLSRSEPAGFDGLFYKCDFSDAGQISATVLQAAKDLGGLNAAIHTAVSPITRKRAADILPAEFSKAFVVDVFGGQVFYQAAAQILKQQGGGRLVGVLSEAVEGREVPSGMAGYVSAKFALKGLLKVLHKELEPAKIAVSALAPGFMDTPLNGDLPPRLIEFISEQAGGRLTAPEDVASVLQKVLDLPLAECAGKTFFIAPGGAELTSRNT